MSIFNCTRICVRETNQLPYIYLIKHIITSSAVVACCGKKKKNPLLAFLVYPARLKNHTTNHEKSISGRNRCFKQKKIFNTRERVGET